MSIYIIYIYIWIRLDIRVYDFLDTVYPEELCRMQDIWRRSFESGQGFPSKSRQVSKSGALYCRILSGFSGRKSVSGPILISIFEYVNVDGRFVSDCSLHHLLEVEVMTDHLSKRRGGHILLVTHSEYINLFRGYLAYYNY